MRKLGLIIGLMMLVWAWSVPVAVYKQPLMATNAGPTLALLGVFPDYLKLEVVQKELVEAAMEVALSASTDVESHQPEIKFSHTEVAVASAPIIAAQSMGIDPRFETALEPVSQAPPEFRITWIKEGEMIDLERKSPEEIELGENMKFVATLINRTDSKLNVVAEVLIRKGDGTLETLIPNYKLQLGKGKEFRVPVGMAAKARRFPPGITQFVALLRDNHGALIDQAQITFKLTLPLH
jgi:hypothetical protein